MNKQVIVEWPPGALEVKACGRNGSIRCSGLSLWRWSDGRVEVVPLTSRGEPAAGAGVQIPPESVAEVSKALLEAARG